MDTVLNLLYIGTWSKNNSVSHMKFLPRPRPTARRVAARSHHFSFPSRMKRPRRKRKIVMAPMYIGPAVKGCDPQYRGSWSAIDSAFGTPYSLQTATTEDLSGLTLAPEAPPLKLGIIMFGSSSQP